MNLPSTADPGPSAARPTLNRLDAARYLGLSLRALDELLATRQLPCVRIGRRVVLLRDDLVGFLAAHREEAVGAPMRRR